MLSSKFFLFLGKMVSINSPVNGLLENVSFDFKSFEFADGGKPNLVHVKIDHIYDKPDLLRFNNQSQNIKTYNGKVFYEYKNCRYINYYDELLLKINFDSEAIKIFSKNDILTREIIYLATLSRVGKMLDIDGIHGLHSMCVYNEKKNFILVGASGIGKSTLCLNLLNSKNNLKYSSDDITLVSAQDRFHFPLRLGFKDQNKLLKYDKGYTSNFVRTNHDVKYLLRADFFYDKNQDKKKREDIIFLHRDSKTSSLGKSKRIEIYQDLFLYFILGVGTPQVLELFWEFGIKDFWTKIKIFLMRIWAAFNLISNSKFYTIYGSNEKETLNHVLRFIQQ